MVKALRGLWHKDEPLYNKTSFGVGGPARFYFEPADCEDLQTALRQYADIPVFFLGWGSNVLISDKGFDGLVIHLGRAFQNCSVKADIITCAAGVSLPLLTQTAAENGLSGFEGLCAIPGSVGGGVRTNAGAYGNSLGDKMLTLQGIDRKGDILTFDVQKNPVFAYRSCQLPLDVIITEATFQGTPDDKEKILAAMAENKEKKRQTQPLGTKTAGSTFKNPDKLAAWRLITEAGLKGFQIGKAQVSEKHANFLINTGGATAQDIYTLIQTIQGKVYQTAGVMLEPEVQFIGQF